MNIEKQIAQTLYITHKLSTVTDYTKIKNTAFKITSLSKEYSNVIRLLFYSPHGRDWAKKKLKVNDFDKFGIKEELLKTVFSNLTEQIEEHFTAKPIILGPNNEKYLSYKDVADFVIKYNCN